MQDSHNSSYTFAIAAHGKPVGELTVQVDQGIDGVDIPHLCQQAAMAVSAQMEAYHQLALENDDMADDPALPWGVTIRFGGIAEGHDLNLTFRHKDYATNVLSFEADPEDSDGEEWYVGDIFICTPVLVREAMELEKPIADHLRHLVVHGMLHLIGYDHELGEAQAAEMENLERVILADMDLPDPYIDHENLMMRKG